LAYFYQTAASIAHAATSTAESDNQHAKAAKIAGRSNKNTLAISIHTFVRGEHAFKCGMEAERR
jgi:hypothetical protein